MIYIESPMCDNYRNTDSVDAVDWRQYHPTLQQMWKIQLTAYKPQTVNKDSQPQTVHKDSQLENVDQPMNSLRKEVIIVEERRINL
jgi:hypothetical protein